MSQSTTVAPTRESTLPLRDCKTLQQAFQSKELSDRIASALPKHLKADAILRSFIQATSRQPDLLKVDLRQSLGGFLTLAELGLPLTPTLQMAHMIPFKGRKEVGSGWEDIMTMNIIIGYAGLLELAMRSGMVGGVHAEVVWPHDKFDFEFGTKQFLTHKPTGAPSADAVPTHVWAMAHLRGDVEPPFEVMPWREVLKVRDGSQGYMRAIQAREDAIKKGYSIPKTYSDAPWVKYPAPMGEKTVFRRLAKWLPKSVELQAGMAIDEPDRGYVDFGPVIEGTVSAMDGLEITGDEQDPSTAFGIRDQNPQQPDAAAIAAAQAERQKAADDMARAAANSAAPAEPKRPRATKPKDPEPPRDEEPPPADENAYGEPASVESTQAPPDSTPPAAEFAAYVFDHTGEIATDEVTNAMEWARDFSNILADTPPDGAAQMIENNADGAAMARLADVKAGVVIDTAITETKQFKDKASPESAAGRPPVVAIPGDDAHKPDWRGYVEAIKAVLPQVGLTQPPSAWIDAQIENLRRCPPAQRIQCVKEISGRLNAIGQRPPEALADLIRPKPAQTAPGADTDGIDRRYINDRKSDVDAITSLDDLRLYTQKASLQERLKDLMATERGKALASEFHAYAWARFEALGGKRPAKT